MPTTVEDVKTLVLELLADYLEESVGDLTTRLKAAGPNMPVDSLDMFDILAAFRERTGIRLPVRKLRRDTLRSVQAFAEFVVEQIGASV